MTTAPTIAARIKQLLEDLRQPLLAPFLAEWPSGCAHRAAPGRALPVLRWLSEMTGDSAAFAGDLVVSVCRAAPSLEWRQTYTARELDASFLDNYGWSEIVGAKGPVVCERLACGFLMLGPATHYPRHRHEAEEIYVPLSGTAEWQQGDSPWCRRPPGTPIHHARNEPHAMRTGASPLLALYLWRSTNLLQSARLDASA